LNIGPADPKKLNTAETLLEASRSCGQPPGGCPVPWWSLWRKSWPIFPPTIRGGNRGRFFGVLDFLVGWEIFVEFFGFEKWCGSLDVNSILEYRETKNPAILQSFCNVYVGVGFRVDFA